MSELDLTKPHMKLDGRPARLIYSELNNVRSLVWAIEQKAGFESVEVSDLRGFNGSAQVIVQAPEPPRERVLWMPVFDIHLDPTCLAADVAMFSDQDGALDFCRRETLTPLAIIPVTITDREPEDE